MLKLNMGLLEMTPFPLKLQEVFQLGHIVERGSQSEQSSLAYIYHIYILKAQM